MAAGPPAARPRKIYRLQRRRKRARHDQGPLHPHQHSASRDRRHDSRRPAHRRAERHPLHPPRIRRAGKNPARRNRALQSEGLIGQSVLGSEFAFDLELFVSPGGYICGEESALLEAIEGKRAEPRNKPPFPVAHGLWNKPTVINNVETFANVPTILVRGVDWYKAQGANGCAGLKFVGVSGDIANPGVYEVPMGTTISRSDLQSCRRHSRRQETERLRALGPVFGLFARVDGGRKTGFQGACRRRLHDGLRRRRRLRRKHMHARHGAQLHEIFPQRILRQMRSLPRRLAKIGRYAHRLDAGPWRVRRSRADRRAFRRAAPYFHLRPRPGSPGANRSVLKHFREEVEAHITRRKCPSGSLRQVYLRPQVIPPRGAHERRRD